MQLLICTGYRYKRGTNEIEAYKLERYEPWHFGIEQKKFTYSNYNNREWEFYTPDRIRLETMNNLIRVVNIEIGRVKGRPITVKKVSSMPELLRGCFNISADRDIPLSSGYFLDAERYIKALGLKPYALDCILEFSHTRSSYTLVRIETDTGTFRYTLKAETDHNRVFAYCVQSKVPFYTPIFGFQPIFDDTQNLNDCFVSVGFGFNIGHFNAAAAAFLQREGSSGMATVRIHGEYEFTIPTEKLYKNATNLFAFLSKIVKSRRYLRWSEADERVRAKSAWQVCNADAFCSLMCIDENELKASVANLPNGGCLKNSFSIQNGYGYYSYSFARMSVLEERHYLRERGIKTPKPVYTPEAFWFGETQTAYTKPTTQFKFDRKNFNEALKGYVDSVEIVPWLTIHFFGLCTFKITDKELLAHRGDFFQYLYDKANDMGAIRW